MLREVVSVQNMFISSTLPTFLFDFCPFDIFHHTYIYLCIVFMYTFIMYTVALKMNHAFETDVAVVVVEKSMEVLKVLGSIKFR